MFIVGFDSYLRHQLEFRPQASAKTVLGVRTGHRLGASDKRQVSLFYLQVVHVVLHEERVVQTPLQQRLVVGQSEDMFGKHIVGRFKAGVHLVPAVIARLVERVAEIQEMLVRKTIGKVGSGQGERPFVVTLHKGPAVHLVARTLDPVAVPVVLAVCRIGSDGMVPRMRQRQAGIELLHQEISLLVTQGHAPGVALVVGHTDDMILHLIGLKVIVHLII